MACGVDAAGGGLKSLCTRVLPRIAPPTLLRLLMPLRSHLANDAVTRCRQRVQQDTVGDRGWKDDPLYGVRKLLLMGAERLDERGWERLHAALDAGDPDDEINDCWVAKEKVRDVYRTDARAP